jgi:hypothetical protein
VASFGPNQIAKRSYHTKRTKKCGLRTNCNEVLTELGPINPNRIYLYMAGPLYLTTLCNEVPWS